MHELAVDHFRMIREECLQQVPAITLINNVCTVFEHDYFFFQKAAVGCQLEFVL
jgi:hypothetical protein